MNSNHHKKMLLLFSHTLTDTQIEDAQKNFGIDKFIYLPKDLQYQWSNISPELENISSIFTLFKDWIENEANAGDIVLVQGDFGLTYNIVEYCKLKGIFPVYSTTSRDVVENKKDDLTILQRSFKHVRFRRY
ncbi:MAG: CRISPR-associated protein Csx20 [Peptococcales bacterium]|jgi:hypothetical protein